MSHTVKYLFAAACLFGLAGCGHAPSAVPDPVGGHMAGGQARTHLFNPLIQHVVIIVQENRSMDNLFNGFPGADTVRQGLRSNGATVPLRSETLVSADIAHSHKDFLIAFDSGRMDGFDLEKFDSTQHPLLPYSFVQQNAVQPYWDMAQQYVLADRMFQSNSGPSFPAHQYLIAGQSDNADNNPASHVWGCDAASTVRVPQLDSSGNQIPGGVYPCFNYMSLADILDAHALSWRYYAPAIGTSGGIWSAYDAVQQIRFSPDWTTKVVSPETNVLTDVQNGILANVTWVVPNRSDSDHASVNNGSGPDWVASVVNAVGTSPFWNSTAIFIVWDDWGGWYDHVRPQQLDVMGLGFRVPLIVVSPFA